MGGFQIMDDSSYHASLPDLTFYEKSVACQAACPVRTDARAYVTAIAKGDYERAYLIARETNPFASTCGNVCGAPCEAACRRGKIDAPIAIRAFAPSLQRDFDAVKAALTLPWSNGPVEGHISRIKFLKRQMFGRANFDLLRLRILA